MKEKERDRKEIKERKGGAIQEERIKKERLDAKILRGKKKKWKFVKRKRMFEKGK